MSAAPAILGLVFAVGSAAGGAYLMDQRDWALPAPLSDSLPGPLDGTWKGTALFANTDDEKDPRLCYWDGRVTLQIARRAQSLQLTMRGVPNPDMRSRCAPLQSSDEYAGQLAVAPGGRIAALSFMDSSGNTWRLRRTRSDWLEGGITPGAGSTRLYAADNSEDPDVFISRDLEAADPRALPRTAIVAGFLVSGLIFGGMLGLLVAALGRFGRRAPTE